IMDGGGVAESKSSRYYRSGKALATVTKKTQDLWIFLSFWKHCPQMAIGPRVWARLALALQLRPAKKPSSRLAGSCANAWPKRKLFTCKWLCPAKATHGMIWPEHGRIIRTLSNSSRTWPTIGVRLMPIPIADEP